MNRFRLAESPEDEISRLAPQSVGSTLASGSGTLSMAGSISRREFLAGATAISLTSHAGSFAAVRVYSPREELSEFDYGSVELTGGPLKQQYDQIHASYRALDNDRLLKVYRERAGLPAPGADMGGWYAADGFVPGHSLGQYISGLARIGRATGDTSCTTKVGDLIDGFAATLGSKNQIYAGPNAERVWPCYVLDKHLVGLIDAYSLSSVGQARELLPRVFEGALPFIPQQGRDRVGKKDPPYDEAYVLPENLFDAYALTGSRAFRDRAVAYLLDRDFFDPLAAGVDVLPGRHAYSHVIALSSAGKARLVMGEDRYLQSMSHAFQFLTTTQQYATGGWGPNETFIEPHRGQLYESLHSTLSHFETPCGSYATIKLARYLLLATGDARYGDGLERVLYNGLLAVKEPDNDGDYPYYSSYSANSQKVFYPKKWPCCSGTLVQGVADYVKNVYFKSANGVAVNLYTPSQVRWEQQGRKVCLIQETDYPAGNSVRLRVECDVPVEFILQLRVPGWVQRVPQIKVNGVRSNVETRRGFLRVHRQWRNDDVVSLEFSQHFGILPIDDLHLNTVAILRGPLMYVLRNPAEAQLRMPNLDSLREDRQGSGIYRTDDADQSGYLVPFYRIGDEHYTTYFEKS